MKAVHMRKAVFAAIIINMAIFLGFATLVMAAGGGGHADAGALLKDFLYRCLNFAVVLGILGYFTLKPIKKALADRRENVNKTLEEAQAARAEAEAKYREVEEKLKTANEEIEQVYSAIREEGELERQKIIANAQAMAEKIQTEAEKSAQREVENARLQLRSEVAALAVKLAEQLIKKNISPEDHDRLLNEYIKSVGELH
jgi:F-type H+-transporting ATPase subunit b